MARDIVNEILAKAQAKTEMPVVVDTSAVDWLITNIQSGVNLPDMKNVKQTPTGYREPESDAESSIFDQDEDLYLFF